MRAVILTWTLTLALLHGKVVAEEQPSEHAFVTFTDQRPLLIALDVQINGKSTTKAWSDFMTFLFGQADQNRDGVINKQEAARIISPRLIVQTSRFARQRIITPALSEIDRNDDGTITPEELSTFYRNNGVAPFHVQFTTGSSGTSSRGFSAVNSGSSSGDEINQQLYEGLDVNRDGKLSSQELKAMTASLLRRDADDDETLNLQEIIGRGDTTGAGGLRLLVEGGGQTTSGEQAPLMHVSMTKTNDALGKRLLQVYGKGTKKKLSGKDILLDQALFTKLDRNQDRHLDVNELARFAMREPELVLTVQVGSGDKDGVVIAKMRKNDAPVKASLGVPANRKAVSVTLGTVALTFQTGNRSGSVLFAPRANQEESVLKRQFDRADQDGNGYLDVQEARRVSFLGIPDALMDPDGDKKIYLKELLAAVKQVSTYRSRAAQSACSLSIEEQGKGLFDVLDANRDGRVTVRELNEVMTQVKKLDRDGDGQLGMTEIPRRYSITAKPGPTQSGLGTVRAIAFGAGGSNRIVRPRVGPTWFQKMDRNDDGDLSPREFLGKLSLFRKLDTDGDGLISVSEAAAVEKR